MRSLFYGYLQKAWVVLVKGYFLRVTTADASISVTARATVFNHGCRENISLGRYVVVDGTLECYRDGRLKIGDYSYIGRSRIFAAHDVTIGKGVLISDNVVIMDSDLHPTSARARYELSVAWANGRFPNVYTDVAGSRTIIDDYAWLGANCIVLKGVHIGEGAVIGAGGVVTGDIPPYSIAIGNPARVIREIPVNER